MELKHILFIIGIVLFIAVVALIKGLILAKYKFTCSKCNNSFNPKWYQVMYEIHSFRNYYIKCPQCHGVRKCQINSKNIK